MNTRETAKVRELLAIWDGEAAFWKSRAETESQANPEEALDIQRKASTFANIYESHANALRNLLDGS